MTEREQAVASRREDETSVLIIGGGPVGLALAGDLGWRGISCILVEQSDGAILQPRQDLVGHRTMEFCRRWGIVGDVESSPYNRDYPQDNVYVAGSLAEGWEIGRYPVPSMNAAEPPPESPQKRERCPQNMFDPILRRYAASHRTVTLRYQTRFERLHLSAGGVAAEVCNRETGRREWLAAQFLVGCDGASSLVRAALGTRMIGNPALTFTTNIIFRCSGFEALHDKRPGYRFIFVGPEGTWATIVAINGRDQWRMSIVRSSVDGRSLDENEIRAAIERAVGCPFDYEILSVMPWRRRELVAEQFGDGPVFIAGDAAHAMSPTGGFGMNTGIGDAVDLSWKIGAVLEGWGGEALLRSYTAERRPVAERNVREASGNLARMLSPPAEPRLLDRTLRGEARRQRIGDDLARAMTREWRTLGIHLGYVYENSPICVSDGTAPPSIEPTEYEQTARPGSRAPHGLLEDGRSTLDLFGRGFVLLRLGSGKPDPAGLVAAAHARKVPFRVVNITCRDIVSLYGRALVLVRPDGHVAWRSNDPPSDPGEILDRVRGASRTSRQDIP